MSSTNPIPSPPISTAPTSVLISTTTPSDPPATVLISILAPYIIQVLAIILLGLIVLIRDGTSVDAIVNILLVIAGGNAIGGGVIGAVHLYTRGRLP